MAAETNNAPARNETMSAMFKSPTTYLLIGLVAGIAITWYLSKSKARLL